MKNQRHIRRQIMGKLEPKVKALWLQLPQYAKPVTAKKPKRIARRTKKRAAEERIYNARVKVWLTEPGNGLCKACPQTVFIYLRSNNATQCHHVRGRRNGLLMMEQFWLPVCDVCHAWIHNNIATARELGLLAPLGQWNQIPKE